MGLAGRKVKQRIGNDPRNLTWSDDAARFGASYLQKFGWTSGTGVGASGDGRASHIKVAQKLDMLGIGAAHQRDPNGLAWKQNRDFERLLERLNGGSGEGEVMKVDGFMRPTEDKEEEAGEEEQVDETEKEKKKRKKSKHADGESKKKRKTSSDAVTVVEETEETVVETVISPTPASSAHVGPPRGHRARFIRSKRLALTDAAAVAAVLGIAPSASTSVPSSGVDTPSEGMLEPLEKLTTSSTSVMDYFKQKLLAKSSGASTPSAFATSSTPRDDEDVPRIGLGASRIRVVEQDEEAPRIGLGAGRALAPAIEDESPRRGLGAPSFGASFGFTSLPASSSTSPPPATPPTQEEDLAAAKAARKAEKKARKEAKRATRAVTTNDAGSPAALAPKEVETTEATITVTAEEDAAARKAEKRARKEARRKAKASEAALVSPEADAGAQTDGAENEDVRKAAKRARKEARHLEKAAPAPEGGETSKKRRRAEAEE